MLDIKNILHLFALYTLQHCDRIISEEYKTLSCLGESKSNHDFVQMRADEVTLSVRNSKGWNVTFDRNPTKVNCIYTVIHVPYSAVWSCMVKHLWLNLSYQWLWMMPVSREKETRGRAGETEGNEFWVFHPAKKMMRWPIWHFVQTVKMILCSE